MYYPFHNITPQIYVHSQMNPVTASQSLLPERFNFIHEQFGSDGNTDGLCSGFYGSVLNRETNYSPWGGSVYFQ